MIGETVHAGLSGPVLTAFQLFSSKRGCSASGEAIRTMIRETDEYKYIAVITIPVTTILTDEQPPEGNIAEKDKVVIARRSLYQTLTGLATQRERIGKLLTDIDLHIESLRAIVKKLT